MGFKPHQAQPDTERQFGLCKNQIHSLDDSTVGHIIPYSKSGKTVKLSAKMANSLIEVAMPEERSIASCGRDCAVTCSRIERLAAFGTASFCPGEATAWTGILDHETRLM